MVIFCGVLLGCAEFVYTANPLHPCGIQHFRKHQSRSDEAFCSGGLKPAVSSVSWWVWSAVGTIQVVGRVVPTARR
ncbi:hypothetical protein Halhy_1226 [Haliscomenobacter hydrossis DSM 1100]|uniref:Uncharacterized protein n=1 Tax=Haliscomenobacter hydrossis (strain ATCC 27775 / DSM 1100 / LMG 10767 / O) TaxID=760192 RepID=F4KTY6_HALH1|nr:hypothetical protein Halhy_1226 [Haliscomenobacter hydrossis DSM 1100]